MHVLARIRSYWRIWASASVVLVCLVPVFLPFAGIEAAGRIFSLTGMLLGLVLFTGIFWSQNSTSATAALVSATLVLTAASHLLAGFSFCFPSPVGGEIVHALAGYVAMFLACMAVYKLLMFNRR